MSQPQYAEKPKQPERREVDIRQYLWVILRHKWIILCAFFLTVASTFLYLSRSVPMYKTSVKILIGEGRGELSLFNEIDFLGQAKLAKQMQTYCELLRTHQLTRKVVENLNLHELWGKENDSFLSKQLQPIPLGSDSTRGQVGDLKELKIRYATEQLQEAIEVTPVRDTNIIEVTVSGADPVLTTNIANEMASVFIDYNLQSIVGEAKSGYEFISEQLKVVEEKLRKAEEALRAFKEKEGVVELTEEAKILLERLSAIETSYNTTIAQRQETEARRDTIRKELKIQAETVTSTTISENPLVQHLRAQLYDLEIDLAGLSKVYPENAPEVEQVETKISQAKEKLEKEVGRVVTSETSSINPTHRSLVDRLIQLEADVIAYGAIAEAQKKVVEQYRVELERLPSKELQLARFTRDKDVNDQTYMMLMQRKEETRLAQAVQTSNVSVADPAIAPLRPYKPQKKLSLMLGAMLGLFLGVGFAFFLEYLEDTVRTPDDVAQHLGLPVLGIVPRVAKAKRAKTPMLVMQESAKDAPVEAYRSLRTNLLSYGSNPLKTIAVTSAGPSEGKSTMVINLGMALARAGQNVLLMDADLRRPMLHRVFDIDRHRGLSAVLAQELTLDEAVVRTGLPNLSVLVSGALPRNPSELLGSDQMKDLISRVREQYDVVLFDSAPVLGMSDGVVLAAETDGAVVVIKAGDASCKALKMAVAQLEQVGAKIYGVVLNDVDVKRDSYYYHYYYYYYYSPYEDEEGKRVRRKRRKR